MGSQLSPPGFRQEETDKAMKHVPIVLKDSNVPLTQTGHRRATALNSCLDTRSYPMEMGFFEQAKRLGVRWTI